MTVSRGTPPRYMLMRWLCVLIVVAACGVPKKPYRPPPPMPVEDVAAWFMRAALAGDESTARTLTLRYDVVAQLSKKADPTEWEATVKETLDQLAREGDGETYVVKAKVVDRKTLTPSEDEKVLRDVDVAIVRFTVNDHASPMPWLFIKTDEGWKFSPKK